VGTRAIRSPLAAVGSLLLSLFLAAMAGCDNDTEPGVGDPIAHAEALIAEGETAAAIAGLKQVLSRDAGSVRARWLLGQAYLGIYDGIAAESQFKKLRDAGFEQVGLDAAYYRALLQQERFEEVLREAVGNEDAAVLVALGEANLGVSGRKNSALERATREAYRAIARMLFRKALKRDGSQYAAQLGLARLALMQGEFEAAADLIDKALPLEPRRADAFILKGALFQLTFKLDAAAAAYHDALRIAPYDMLARVGLIRVLLARKEYPQAMHVVRALLSDHPKSPIAKTLLARTHLLNGEPATAVGILHKLVGIDGHNAEALRLLVEALISLGQYEQALSVANELERPGGEPRYARRARAEIGLKQGDTQTAMTLLRGMPADDFKSLALLGRTYLGMGNVERAEWYLGRARAVAAAQAKNPRQVPVSLWVNLIPEGISSEAYDTAVALAQRRVEASPNDASARHAVGAAHLAAGDEVAARKSFHAALRQDPNYLPSLLALAELDVADGNFDVAVLMFERALKVDRSNVRALVGLAELRDEVPAE